MTHMNKYELVDKISELADQCTAERFGTIMASNIFDNEAWKSNIVDAQGAALMIELIKYMFYMDEKLDNILQILKTQEKE